MTTLLIEIPEKSEKTLSELVEQLGGKVLAANSEDKKIKISKKLQILNDLEESLSFVKLHQQGKAKAKSIDELLNEL